MKFDAVAVKIALVLMGCAFVFSNPGVCAHLSVKSSFGYGTRRIRESKILFTIRPDLKEGEVAKLFGDQKVNGRIVNVEGLITSLTKELRGDFEKVLTARNELMQRVIQAAKEGEKPWEVYNFLDPNTVIEDADGKHLTVAQIRQGMLDGFYGIKTEYTWQLNEKVPVPKQLLKPGMEGTGPASDMGMLMSAINAGAHGAVSWMFDSEDARPGNLKKLLEQHLNLKQVIAGDWDGKTFTHPTKKDEETGKPKEYKIEISRDKWPVIMHRVPGIHLESKIGTINGEEAVRDMITWLAVYTLNNYDNLREKENQGVYFYVPKIETPQEALVVAKSIKGLEKAIGVPQGTIKIKMLNERGEYALAQEAIMWVLRDWLVGPNVGRWDYGFSRQQMFQDFPEMSYRKDILAVGMTEPSMDYYTVRNGLLATLAGGMPIGGMAAQLKNQPKPREPQDIQDEKIKNNELAELAINGDKMRERISGIFMMERNGKWELFDKYRQSWVATVEPGYVKAGYEPLATDGAKSQVVIEYLKPLQDLVDNLNPNIIASFKELGLLNQDGKIVVKRFTQNDLTPEKLYSMDTWHKLLDPPEGKFTVRGILDAIHFAGEFPYQVLAWGNYAAAIEDPNMGNGYYGINRNIFTGNRIMSDHATVEGIDQFLINGVRHGLKFTQDGEISGEQLALVQGTSLGKITVKTGESLTPEIFLKLWEWKKEQVRQLFDTYEQMGILKNRTEADKVAQLSMEVLKRLVVTQDSNSRWVPQPVHIRNVSKILITLYEDMQSSGTGTYDLKRSYAILDAIFANRNFLVVQIGNARTSPEREWAERLLRYHDSVHNIFSR